MPWWLWESSGSNRIQEKWKSVFIHGIQGSTSDLSASVLGKYTHTPCLDTVVRRDMIGCSLVGFLRSQARMYEAVRHAHAHFVPDPSPSLHSQVANENICMLPSHMTGTMLSEASQT